MYISAPSFIIKPRVGSLAAEEGGICQFTVCATLAIHLASTTLSYRLVFLPTGEVRETAPHVLRTRQEMLQHNILPVSKATFHCTNMTFLL